MTELPRRGRQSGGRGGVRASGPAQLVALPLRAVSPAAPPESQPTAPQEHHLGDRLAAYIDGELDHDARERIQAHLATCSGCLAEADAQRRVKELLAAGSEPGPSAFLTSRLLAIAAEDDGPSDADRLPGGVARRFGAGALDAGSFGGGAMFGSNALGAGRPLAGVDPRAESRSGVFGRGRRFAFVAAAGAFSVAAVALSSALTVGTDTTVDEPYGTTTPVAETTATIGGSTVQAPLFHDGLTGNGPLAAALDAAPSPSASALPTAYPQIRR